MKSVLVTAIVITTTALSLQAAEPPADAKAAVGQLLSAITTGDYPAFVANGDAAFKGLTKEAFDPVVTQLSPRFKAGYDLAYLGELKQRGYQVTLWKLAFKDGGDDALATLSFKDGKVGGFWIK
jgi:hypothetical protein